MTDLNKPAFSLTVQELVDVIKSELKTEPVKTEKKESKPIRGIHGLAKAFGISPVTAQKLKNSGKIPYSQYGRVILFEYDAVFDALSHLNKKGGKNAK